MNPSRSRRAVVIINPLSGRGRQAPQIEHHTALAKDVLGRYGIDATIRATTKGGDAQAFAEDAVKAGCDLVIAWGGDGTVNEAARALVASDVPLAIVPAGSGNGLASDLLIPTTPQAALQLAATGKTLRIDVGQMEECYFFNIAGIGIDAVIAGRFATRGMNQRGLAGYLQLSSAELMRYRCQHYDVRIDNDTARHRAMLIAVANGRQYGNRLFIAPGARPDDGLFEVVVVDELSLLSIAWRLPALFRGKLTSGRGITMRAGRSLSIAAPGPIPFHVDGEPRMGHDRVTVRMHPRALSVVTGPP